MKALADRPILNTIPSSDAAFAEHVTRVVERDGFRHAEQLQARLRRLFPRVLVRERVLSAERPTWYVYRDGVWRPPEDSDWWTAPGVPRVELSVDGWIMRTNPAARSILNLGHASDQRHFTDFVAPGTLEDAQTLFGLVRAGRDLSATVLLRPNLGELLACELRAFREGDVLVALFRLDDDLEVAAPPEPPQVAVVGYPASDVAFQGYADLLLGRMPEPTPDGLALRLRRLYPHARVETGDREWIAIRDGDVVEGPVDGWWLNEALPRVEYDGDGVILKANEAAVALLGHDLVGRHWHEFVTPGSTDQVIAMIRIIQRAGVAVSRFRMPTGDGSLVEFDSFTEARDDLLTTTMRPREG